MASEMTWISSCRSTRDVEAVFPDHRLPLIEMHSGTFILAGQLDDHSSILEAGGSMNTADILIEIDALISRLGKAKALLAGTEITIKRKPGRPSRVSLSGKAPSSIPAKSAAKPLVRRTMSPEARTKIAAAQKARWAKSKKAAKKAARKVAAAPAVKSAAPNGVAPKTAPAKKAVSAKKVVRAKSKSPVTPAS